MDRNEIVKLLAVAMCYDNRSPGEAIVNAWHDAAQRQHWTFEGASDAIQAHYSERTEFIQPGHITERIRNQRAQPPPPGSARQLPRGNYADPAHIKECIAQVSKELGWKRVEPAHRHPALAVRCPHVACYAPAEKPCVRRISRGSRRGQTEQLTEPHPSRITEWETTCDK